METRQFMIICFLDLTITLLLIADISKMNRMEERLQYLERWRDVIHEIIVREKLKKKEEDRYGYRRNKSKS